MTLHQSQSRNEFLTRQKDSTFCRTEEEEGTRSSLLSLFFQPSLCFPSLFSVFPFSFPSFSSVFYERIVEGTRGRCLSRRNHLCFHAVLLFVSKGHLQWFLLLILLQDLVINKLHCSNNFGDKLDDISIRSGSPVSSFGASGQTTLILRSGRGVKQSLIQRRTNKRQDKERWPGN